MSPTLSGCIAQECIKKNLKISIFPQNSLCKLYYLDSNTCWLFFFLLPIWICISKAESMTKQLSCPAGTWRQAWYDQQVGQKLLSSNRQRLLMPLQCLFGFPLLTLEPKVWAIIDLLIGLFSTFSRDFFQIGLPPISDMLIHKTKILLYSKGSYFLYFVPFSVWLSTCQA